MLRGIVLVLWAAALAFAAVLPTESGDAFYFAFDGQAGAVNAYGQRLWTVPGELIASDPMGSCLATAHRVFEDALFLGTAVTLYTADGRFLWATIVNINATALATNCVEAAIGGIDGTLLRIKDGKVVERQKHDKPIFALAYKVDGSLAVGTGDPVSGFTAYVDRCGNSITATKTDAPYLVVNSPGFGTIRYRGGLAPQLRPPASASQDCRSFVYAVYDTLYNNTTPLVELPLPIIAAAVSGDGRTVAAATAEKLYIIRGGKIAAELDAPMVRSIALSWDGLTLAYTSDSALAVQRFKIVRIETRGCPLQTTATIGKFTYPLPADAYVPAEADAATANVAEGDALRCVPTQNVTKLQPITAITYRVEYRIEAPPLVRGPQWAFGLVALYAEPEIKVPADPPLKEVKLILEDWEMNGTRRGFPMPSITLGVSGPTRIRPIYRLEHQPEVTVGDVKYVVKSVTLFDRMGRPMTDVADVPAYAKVAYETRRVVAWDIPDNSSSVEVREGEKATLTAPPELDFGNGTRLVFRQWNTGDRSPSITVGPGRYVALYDTHFLVAFRATNYTYAQWVPKGSRISAPKVSKVYDDGQTRVFVTQWTAPDGQPAQFPHTVTAPVNFTAVERREHYARIVVWDRKEEGWYPEGYELLIDDAEKRKWLLWQFKDWEPFPVIDAPGEYRAVYELDYLAVSVLAVVVALMVGAAVALRRR
ncbi:MAG: hypothetical protein ACO2PM_25800 [Pyrobaculum sp.]|jgi:hypothetical protein